MVSASMGRSWMVVAGASLLLTACGGGGSASPALVSVPRPLPASTADSGGLTLVAASPTSASTVGAAVLPVAVVAPVVAPAPVVTPAPVAAATPLPAPTPVAPAAPLVVPAPVVTPAPVAVATTYSITASVTGLGAGKTLVLQNGADSLSFTSNTSSSFATKLATGAGYAITVNTNPVGQSCGVTNGSATVAGANVTNVMVSCSTPKAAPALFSDGFESQGLGTVSNNVQWSSSVAVQVSNEYAKDGAYSLKFTFPATDETRDSWSEQRFSLGKPYKEIWISYDLRVPENYYHREPASGSSNNKGFLMLWSGDYGNPSGPLIGTEFWPESDGSSTASVRLYGVGFDKHFWGACPGIVKISDRGKWIKITTHTKYASSANNDGIARLWKTYSDGKTELACNITNGAWYAPSAQGFDSGYLMGWSNSGYATETRFFIDNFVVSETPLMSSP